jgi:hypothetical protein
MAASRRLEEAQDAHDGERDEVEEDEGGQHGAVPVAEVNH